MSSTQIQLESDRVVSVQTQSITALSSVRNGTMRNLEGEDDFFSFNLLIAATDKKSHLKSTAIAIQSVSYKLALF